MHNLCLLSIYCRNKTHCEERQSTIQKMWDTNSTVNKTNQQYRYYTAATYYWRIYSNISCQSQSALQYISISHPDIRAKHCAYGHSVLTLLNPRGVTTVSHKYSSTVKRHATVVVAVPSTVHHPANYKYILFHIKFMNENKLFVRIIYYKLLEIHSYGTWSYYNSPFLKRKHLHRGCSNGSKISYGTVFHSYIWMAYRQSPYSIRTRQFLENSCFSPATHKLRFTLQPIRPEVNNLRKIDFSVRYQNQIVSFISLWDKYKNEYVISIALSLYIGHLLQRSLQFTWTASTSDNSMQPIFSTSLTLQMSCQLFPPVGGVNWDTMKRPAAVDSPAPPSHLLLQWRHKQPELLFC
jgi:hypothetical protein